MAETALSTIGVVFGWGKGTLKNAPSSWKEVEECISIGEVTVEKETIDVTPLKAKRHHYISGYETVTETLTTAFNRTDTFEAQWKEILDAYDAKESNEEIWFCAYCPGLSNMDVYIVQPGSIPRNAYEVGSALQVTVSSTIIDLPDPITAVKPTEPTNE